MVMSHIEQHSAQPTGTDSEEYLGMVKSYNARRGFGFVACEQTAMRFGRDVYIAKAEAQLVANAEFSAAAGAVRAPGEKAAPTLAEEDLVRFRVKLSAEGYPQAEKIRCIQKFQGTVLEAPAEEDPATGATPPSGRILTDGALGANGAREVILTRAACGRARLAAGDRVTFCVREQQPHYGRHRGAPQEALLVMLVPRPQHNLGAILGCCILSLPRAPAPVTGGGRANLHLDCHALGDRLILSGLPQDADQAELMRFFSKHGATAASVAQSKGGNFASVAFPGMSEVARFVARSVHTFADDKETRLARLLPRGGHGSHGYSAARLPGLPAPQIAGGVESGSLSLTWSPVVLATGYLVELRPAGVQAQWCSVDASEGRLLNCGEEGARFGRDCSSCKVSGLPANVVFEARVTYFTDCGCGSDTSDPSEWCLAYPNAASQPSPQQQQQAQQQQQQQAQQQAATLAAAAAMAAGMGMPLMQVNGAGFCQTAPMMQQQQSWPTQMMQTQQLQVATASGACAGGLGSGSGSADCMGGSGGAYRCIHGNMCITPCAPEIRPADDFGFSLLVQWPAVANASAYVVELRESGSPQVERFVRQVPPQALGSLVELRVGGLRPRGGQGRCYVAQVRSVTACGCESEPSPPAASHTFGYMPQAATSQQQQQQQQMFVPALSLAAACGSPQNGQQQSAPTFTPFCPLPASNSPTEASMMQQEQMMQQQAKLSPWQQQQTMPQMGMPQQQQMQMQQMSSTQQQMQSMQQMQQGEQQQQQSYDQKLAPWQLQQSAPIGSASPQGLPSLLRSSRPQAEFPAEGSYVAKEAAAAPELPGQLPTEEEECIILD